MLYGFPTFSLGARKLFITNLSSAQPTVLNIAVHLFLVFPFLFNLGTVAVVVSCTKGNQPTTLLMLKHDLYISI